tara:strand:+ start:1004 stop:1306 length:303 start_codon:yes stop_codon:yes gene_type:complete
MMATKTIPMVVETPASKRAVAMVFGALISLRNQRIMRPVMMVTKIPSMNAHWTAKRHAVAMGLNTKKKPATTAMKTIPMDVGTPVSGLGVEMVSSEQMQP